MKKISLICFVLAGIQVSFAQSGIPAYAGEHVLYNIYGESFSVDAIHRIKDGVIEYESRESLHDIEVSDVVRIRKGAIQYLVVHDSLAVVHRHEPFRYQRFDQALDSAWNQNNEQTYSKLGTIHANMHITPIGGIFGGFLLAPTVIFPVVVAAVPPSPGREYIQDPRSFNEIPAYREAFIQEAHRIKKRGVLIGVTGFFVTALTVFALTSVSFQ